MPFTLLDWIALKLMGWWRVTFQSWILFLLGQDLVGFFFFFLPSSNPKIGAFFFSLWFCVLSWKREMGSYANLARRAVETDMPIMVQVIKEVFLFIFLFCLSHWDLICGLNDFQWVIGLMMRFFLCVYRCRNCFEELRMLCLWLRFVLFIYYEFVCMCDSNFGIRIN